MKRGTITSVSAAAANETLTSALDHAIDPPAPPIGTLGSVVQTALSTLLSNNEKVMVLVNYHQRTIDLVRESSANVAAVEGALSPWFTLKLNPIDSTASTTAFAAANAANSDGLCRGLGDSPVDSTEVLDAAWIDLISQTFGFSQNTYNVSGLVNAIEDMFATAASASDASLSGHSSGTLVIEQNAGTVKLYIGATDLFDASSYDTNGLIRRYTVGTDGSTTASSKGIFG